MPQQQNCNKNCQRTDSGKEAFLAPPNLDVIAELLTLAKTGIFSYFFNDARLNELASHISLLFAENAQLKKLVNLLPTKPTATVSATNVTIEFGPNTEYQLIIPVSGKQDRMYVADQLFHAALTLKRQEIEYDKQHKLPFSD